MKQKLLIKSNEIKNFFREPKHRFLNIGLIWIIGAALTTLSSCGKYRGADNDPKDLAYSRNAKNVALLFSAPNDLDGPPTDVKALQPIMQGLHFKVVTISNATRSDIINETAKASKDVGEKGTLFWYFSGHGAQNGELVSQGGTGVDFKDVTKAIMQARSEPIKRLLVFVDACFSGQLVNGTSAVIGSSGSTTSSGVRSQNFNLADDENAETQADEDELAATGSEKVATSIRSAISDSYDYKSGQLFEQALVMSAARKIETSLDLGRANGGAFTYALRKTFEELDRAAGKPTVRNLVDKTITKTKDIVDNRHIPVYREYPSKGILDDYLYEPGSIQSSIQPSSSAISFDDSDRIRFTLNDNDNAQAFYDEMDVTSRIDGNRRVKTFSTIGYPGSQSLEFSCWQNIDSERNHACELSVERLYSGRKAFKYHVSRTDESIYVIRNDTDYTSVSEPIFNLFKKQSTTEVSSETDAQIGWTVIGGEEFSIPKEDAPMQLRCRRDGTDYFCKFLIKRP